MMTYKLIALSFMITTPLFSLILSRMLRLNRFNIGLPDLALPIFAVQIVLLSRLFFKHSFLPQYLVMMSLIVIVVSLYQLLKTKQFQYKRFMKVAWRLGFIATYMFYIATTIILFLQ